MKASKNSFNSFSTLRVKDKEYGYFSLNSESLTTLANISRLPISIKILLENLLRHEDGVTCSKEDIVALAQCAENSGDQEIAFHPARVLMQDFTGVPAIVDLAAMRHALTLRGKDPDKVNPLTPVDLVIDHSVSIDAFASSSAFAENVNMEMSRNLERYEFLKWGQSAFANFRVVPPGTGICHQVNLEYLAKTVWTSDIDGQPVAYPDTLVGTDSHTTMINGLGVLGWGVGGIEAEAAMLGQPVSMLIPKVVGFELSGKLREGITATDLVLQIVQMLRKHGVVGKFVEFYGEGMGALSLADRATIANMAPEYGATCGFFPVDQKTLTYLELTGREAETIDLVEAYCKAQGLWHDHLSPIPQFAEHLRLNISDVEASLAGPKRPQDRVALTQLKTAIDQFIELDGKAGAIDQNFPLPGTEENMHHGDVVIAAITSCTNTSNPAVMLAAGLLAKKAVAAGLSRKPWVKSSLAPGSKVVTDYLVKAGLQPYLDQLGFNLVGYGCTTCIGNSGPLPENVANCVIENNLVVCSVLSGNRNFEGRIHPLVKTNWLASPPLVVAFALAGTTRIDLSTEPLGVSPNGTDIYLKDLWPSSNDIEQAMQLIDKTMFQQQYSQVFAGDESWRAIATGTDKTYQFAVDSTYIQLPPFFEKQYTDTEKKNIQDARILALFGDSVTTDHISPAGNIPIDSPAANYLRSKGVKEADFNSFGSRRGNHQVMMRGTFGNIRIHNQMVPGIEGGYTRIAATQEPIFIYDAAMHYLENNIATVIFAGKEYGTGSSRDWAAKGTLLLGVKAVIAESFERIHRSNLIGMGVLPLQFVTGNSLASLALTGDERIDIIGLEGAFTAKKNYQLIIHQANGASREISVLSRLDTAMEVNYYLAGGILPFVLKQM